MIGQNRLGNNNGTVTVMALGIMLFLGIIMAGVLPMITQEVRAGAVNRDGVEAQYAAEAGAKVAIEALINKSQSWNWLNNDRAFDPAYAKGVKNYSVVVTPPITDGSPPATGTAYTIASTGKVRGVIRTAKVKVTLGSGASNALDHAIYSQGALSIASGTVTGDIASNGLLSINNSVNVIGDIAYVSANMTHEQLQKQATGTVTQETSIPPTLVVSSLMTSAYSNSSFPTTGGTSLPNSSTALTGSFDINSNPTSGKYYRNANYSNWSHTYSVADDQSVFIYIKADPNNKKTQGNYIIGTPITGGGNITIYATGNITVHGNITAKNLIIYSEKTVTMTGGATIADNVTIIGKNATGNAFYMNGARINENQPTHVTKVLAYGNANMSAGTIGGIAAVAASGTITRNTFLSDTTVLIAQGNINGPSGSSGGIYSNGSITINSGEISQIKSESALKTLGFKLGAEGGSETSITWGE